jgi:Outer membrane protein beta-barrel domain
MIRKFATVPGFRVVLTWMAVTILAGATTVYAQETPAQQPASQSPASQPPSAQSPAAQQPPDKSSQEATPEDIGPRKVKPKEFKNWVFNAGGGGSLTNGTTAKFVRGGGGIGAAGVARNYSKYFGFRLDFQFDNLPLRDSAQVLAQAPGATSHVYSLMLDPIINIPLTNDWGGYVLFGPAFYHRSGKLDSSTALPGSACNPFFLWWGPCYNSSLPVSGDFLHASQNEFGDNFGFGMTRKLNSKIEIYAEFRYLHGTHYGITTDLRPITLGVRW